MASGSIIHPGIIEHIEGNKILVKILSKSACSSCHAKSACTMADMEEKMIEVESEHSSDWKEGDGVMVRMDESLGHKAVFLGYVLPLIVLVGSIVVFLSLFSNEGLAAVLSVLMLVPYYAVLFLFRNRLQKQFRFRLE